MKSHKRAPKSTASKTLIALRKAMDKTQQEFAVFVLECAISTLARYETSDPPRGDVLLKLAEIADKHQHTAIAATFRMLYLDGIVEKLGGGIIVTGGSGYVIWKLTTPAELELVQKTMHELEEMRGLREPGYVHDHQKMLSAVTGNLSGRAPGTQTKTFD